MTSPTSTQTSNTWLGSFVKNSSSIGAQAVTTIVAAGIGSYLGFSSSTVALVAEGSILTGTAIYTTHQRNPGLLGTIGKVMVAGLVLTAGMHFECQRIQSCKSFEDSVLHPTTSSHDAVSDSTNSTLYFNSPNATLPPSPFEQLNCSLTIENSQALIDCAMSNEINTTSALNACEHLISNNTTTNSSDIEDYKPWGYCIATQIWNQTQTNPS